MTFSWEPAKPFWDQLGVRACVLGHFNLTLYNPMDCSPPGSSVHGILQARILEWVAMSSSREEGFPHGSDGALASVCIWETRVWSPGWEDPLEKETPSPITPTGYMGSQRVRDDFLQGIFLAKVSKPSFLYLLNCRQILYKLSHQRSPIGSPTHSDRAQGSPLNKISEIILPLTKMRGETAEIHTCDIYYMCVLDLEIRTPKWLKPLQSIRIMPPTHWVLPDIQRK